MFNRTKKNILITVLALIGLLFITLSFGIFTPPKQASAAQIEQDRFYYHYDTNAYTSSSTFNVSASDGNITGRIDFMPTSATSSKYQENISSLRQKITMQTYFYGFKESNKNAFTSGVTNYNSISNIATYRLYSTTTYGSTSFNVSYSAVQQYDYIALVMDIKTVYVHDSGAYRYNDYYCNIFSTIVPLAKSNDLISKVDTAVASAYTVSDSNATTRANVIKKLLPFSSYGYIESSKAGNVTVLYKGYDQNGIISDKSFAFNVADKNLLRNKEYAKYLLLKTEFSKLSDFNVGRKGLANAGNGYILNEKYTVIEALDISVDMSNFYSPVITIVYDNITANDIAFTVMSNDEEYSELKIDVYCGDIESNGQTGKITFEYVDVETIAASTVHWIFEISSNTEDIQVVTDGDTRVEITDTALIVYYDLSKQNSLLNLSISYIGEVHEARLYDVELNYTEFELDFDAVEERARKVTFIAYDLGIKNAVAVPSNIITGVGTSVTDFYYFPAYGDIINGAIQKELKELNYCYYADATLSAPVMYTTNPAEIEQKVQNGETVGKYVINIEYGYHPLFFVESEGLAQDYYKFMISPFASTLTVNGTYFVDGESIPNGYRVSSITIPSNYLISSKQDKEDYAKSTWTFNQGFNDKAIIPVIVNYSDKYIVKFEYFARYNNTPFALLTSFSGEAKVTDFKDITKPTAKELAQVLANNGTEKVVEELSFLGLVKPDESLITYECTGFGVYEYTVPYTYASVKAQESDGSYSETKVPMTKYSDWTKQWGEDWGVTMLNHPGNIYFDSNSTHLKDNLYGLFACIQFKEQVKNVYDWFNDVTNGGCVIEYQVKEVKGSDVYTFVTENKILLTAATTLGGFMIGGATGAVIGALIPSVIQAGCEIVNDENATYYSHFFYLDGTSKLAYVSNSGADDYEDNDTSIGNKGEDIKDKVGEDLGNFWEGVKDFFKTFGAYVVTILSSITGLIVLIYVFKLLSKVWASDELYGVFKILLTLIIVGATLALFYLVGHVLVYNWVLNLGGL